MLLSAKNLEKYFGERLIFRVDSLTIHRGDKIGIVGPNGSGKSTLLKVLCKKAGADGGKIDIRGRISYVDQLDENHGENNPDDLNASIFFSKPDPKSGGEIMRKKLAAAFSESFDILALDEPTSNLDSDGIETLGAMLSGVETMLLISHDRALLDSHCNKILELKDGKINIFSGGYSEYSAASQSAKLRQESLYEDYLHEKKRLERSIKTANERASKMKKAPSRMGNSEARLHRRESTAKQGKILSAATGIASRLERLEPLKKPENTRPIKPDFSLTNPPKNKIIFSCDDLNFSYFDGEKENEIFKNARFEIQNGERIGIIGANGMGKTTLLRLICERADIIKRAPKTKLGTMSQDFSDLDFEATVLENVLFNAVQNQTICRTTLANMGFSGDDVHKKISVLSGGELVKISLSKLILSDCNTLILDEPTNYLDIDSLKEVESALIGYDGTLVFVSHDRAFISSVATRTLTIKSKQIS